MKNKNVKPMKKLISTALLILLAFSSFALTDALKLKITGNGSWDEAVVRFIDGATPGFDGSYDAYKVLSPNPDVPSIYTNTVDDIALSINAMPKLIESKSIPLLLRINVENTYTIEGFEIGLFPSNVKILLEDLLMDSIIDLRIDSSYEILIGTDSLNNNNRFLLHFIVSSQVQPGTVISYQKISATQGNFTGILDDFDNVGWLSIASLGDLDKDGVSDIVVGAIGDDDGDCSDKGALWVMFLNTDGTVKSHQKISATQGNFTGILDGGDFFGWGSVTPLGDLDGDSVIDIAVGAIGDDDGGINRGALWIIFLNTDGTVKSHQKISATQGNFTGILDNSDWFGHSVTSLGDLDGDGITDIAVGARFDDDGGVVGMGAVWVIFLNADGTVKSHQKISATQGNFTGVLDGSDYFGWSVASLGDLDKDGVTDIAVGATFDDDGNNNTGAVWILFLNTDGTVKSHQKISAIQGNFTGTLDSYDLFGTSITPVGDLDIDGVTDIAVGAYQDDDGGFNRGAVWILFLNTDGTVKSHQKISATQGNFTGILDNYDGFGTSVTSIGDLDGNGITDIAVGAYQDDDGGDSRGAVWVLFLEGPALPLSLIGFSVTDVSCAGDSDGSATANVSGGTPPYSYLWSNGQTTLTATGLSAGTYNVTITDINDLTITDNVTINEPEEIIADFVYEIKGNNIQKKKIQVTFLNNSSGAISYYWDFDDGQTSNDPNPFHIYTKFGTYQVRLIASNGGCQDTISKQLNLQNTTGILKKEKLADIQIYPNPTSGEILIAANTNKITSVMIYDIQGKLIKNDENIFVKDSKINLSQQKNGVYLMEIILEDNSHIRKTIVKY